MDCYTCWMSNKRSTYWSHDIYRNISTPFSLPGACFAGEKWWDYLLHWSDLHLHPWAWASAPLPGGRSAVAAWSVQSWLHVYTKLHQSSIVPCPILVMWSGEHWNQSCDIFYSFNLTMKCVLCKHYVQQYMWLVTASQPYQNLSSSRIDAFEYCLHLSLTMSTEIP